MNDYWEFVFGMLGFAALLMTIVYLIMHASKEKP